MKQQLLSGRDLGSAQSSLHAAALELDALDGCADPVPTERKPLQSETELRWVTMTQKLLDRAEGPTPREDSVIALGESEDLRMRPTWCHSVLQKRVNMSSKSRSTYNEDLALRMNDSMRDKSFGSRWVSSPQSAVQMTWALISCLLISWDLLTIPMEVFDDEDFTNFLRYVSFGSLSFWLLDMPLHFVFGVQRGGIVELRPQVLCKVYLRTWFPVDFLIISIDIAVILMEAFVDRSVGGALRSMRFLRSLRALRLIRLLRVAKLQRELSLLANRFLSTYVFMVMRIVAALMVMLSINHIIACCWFSVGARGAQNSWIENFNLQEAGIFESYIISLHWSLTQFTPSTNNIAPANEVERLFAVFVILFAMGCFSSFVGSITATVNALRSIQATKIKQNNQVLSFFAERSVSLDLYRKVQYVIRTEKLTDDPVMERDVALLKLLPQRFRKQLHEEMYLGILMNLKFWPSGVKTREGIFLTEVCHLAMEEEVVRKFQDVFLPGTECQHAYLIEQGSSMCYTCGPLQDLTVSDDDSLCLISLWAEWQHHGRLASKLGTSRYVTLDSEKFANLAWRWAGPFYRYLQIFGVLLTGAVENRSQEVGDDLTVTDMALNKEEVLALSLRAQSFDNILRKHHTYHHSEVAETSAGFNGTFVRLRSSIAKAAPRGIR